MLSCGIQFGAGFDRFTVARIMNSIPNDSDYNFLVIGSSPGAVACAKEASLAGRKTAIVRWREYTPAEEEGYDEDLEAMASVFEGDMYSELSYGNASRNDLGPMSYNASTMTTSIREKRSDKKGSKVQMRGRRVRRSRLDLNNELYKRGREGRRLMLKAATMQHSLNQAVNFGWRVRTSIEKMSINWKKMSEVVMDHIMEANYVMMKELADAGVEIIEGKPSFVNCHTVKIVASDTIEYYITADIICAAPNSEAILPQEVRGSAKYGITCDDFIRLSQAPGRTLIVGSTPEGLECAGILACFEIPVVVVSRSELLKGHDKEISHMIVEDLKSRGVAFLEQTNLESLIKNGDKLEANFTSAIISEGDDGSIDNFTITFDTVVFAVGQKTDLTSLQLGNVGIELDMFEKKICTNLNNETCVPNIYAVGDAVATYPHSPEISETAGQLLGKRLFRDGTETMDYSMAAHMISTPIEYGYAGLSEDGAQHRFGKECVQVYRIMYNPMEYAAFRKDKQCLVKAVVFKPKNLIIGLHMFGPDAGEIIQGFAGAIKMGMTLEKLQALVSIPTTKAREVTKVKEWELTDHESEYDSNLN